MTKREKPSAGVVSPDDLDRRDPDRAERFSIIDEMRSAFEGVSTEEIEREAAHALDEVREEMRAERDTATPPLRR